MDAELVAKIREVIRNELCEQFNDSSWWIDMDGLNSNADDVQIDGILDIKALSEAVAAAGLGQP